MPVSIPAPEPIERDEDLFLVFTRSEKPRDRWRVGTESEKFAVHGEDLSPLVYEGPQGIEGIFAHLTERHGWTPQAEFEGGPAISLVRGLESITLEPGAQFELSGAPHASIHETAAAFDAHMAELGTLPASFDLRWLGVGFHPFAKQSDLPWVPKLRYGIMREYLPTRGSMALDMMRRTATVQANLDYSSESDALRKLRVAMKITPVVTAMFANSPFAEGARSGDVSRRSRVWLNMDPDRSGLLEFVWSEKASYRDYVEWALDVPMFLVKRGSRVLKNTGQTFRSFLRDGFEGERATQGDWETHLGTLFPEARLKRTIELRCADSQNGALTSALPALWKGLLYDDQVLHALEAKTASLSFAEVMRSRAEVPAGGLRGTLGGEPLQGWAEALLDHATTALDRADLRNGRGESESIHLARLASLIERGQSPGDALLEKVANGPGFGASVLEHCAV
jgi:glutamate--cysteine ligase